MVFSFSSEPPSEPPENTSAKKPYEHPLDALTGGAFSAPTSGERAARIREWLASDPPVEKMQEVFKELSQRDKGAAKQLRERLDDIRRARHQEAIAEEWSTKAQALLEAPRINIADAMAWQRDAAKAGAPLSREPLLTIKTQLASRVKGIEDLQVRVQVHCEAAVLLAQRIEILSTKPWRDAQAALEPLRTDVASWMAQAGDIMTDANWFSVDAKFPHQIESSRAQLQLVWEAFALAVAQAAAAAQDAQALLPSVPVWADEIRQARGIPIAVEAEKPARPVIDPAIRDKAVAAVHEALLNLEKETAEGHGKASVGAAAALRAVLRDSGQYIDQALEHQVNAALVAAGELQGWQRWSADQIREQLLEQAEGLLQRPAGQELGGRKMQEVLRKLREQWKHADQGGMPNHTLWKRFDEACNEAHKVVDAWLEKVKVEMDANKAQRMALIEEMKAWIQANTSLENWKEQFRALHQFAHRWREGGHVSEKIYAELQPLWKQVQKEAGKALDAAQKKSLDLRRAMIAEAQELGAQASLRIDAVKELQQRWQAEAQAVPMERRQEQKLWDAFRKPIDEAFQRKTTERQRANEALHAHDRAVMEASHALEQASASGDAQKIQAAMAALDAAVRGKTAVQVTVDAIKEVDVTADASAQTATPATASESAPPVASQASQEPSTHAEATQDEQRAPDESESPQADASADTAPAPSQEDSATAPATPVRKPVVAVRGDDRPGVKKDAKLQPSRATQDRKDTRFARANRAGDDKGRQRRADPPSRLTQGPRGPRLSDAAFRAQRNALEQAQQALKKLSAQAHGEALTKLVLAWEKRDAQQLPATSELGPRVSASVRNNWSQALQAPPAAANAAQTLLRLEIAAEVPSPAAYHNARRALQLHLLTRRNDPSPQQTWSQDVAQILGTSYDAQDAQRLQSVLKVLVRSKN